MDKKIKDHIAEHKLSDDQILKALQAFKPADSQNADTPEASGGNGESGKVENVPTSEAHANPEEPSGATGGDEGRSAFTKEELDKWIDKKVAEKIKNLPKDQPPVIPTFENPTRPKQWKVLK